MVDQFPSLEFQNTPLLRQKKKIQYLCCVIDSEGSKLCLGENLVTPFRKIV